MTSSCRSLVNDLEHAAYRAGRVGSRTDKTELTSLKPELPMVRERWEKG